MTAAVRMVVHGRVQGVGFRAFAHSLARRLGIKGWARNLPDGTVEIAAEALPAALDAYESGLKAGNGWCSVSSIAKTEIPVQGFTSFEIIG
jgi:acylphosphatase